MFVLLRNGQEESSFYWYVFRVIFTRNNLANVNTFALVFLDRNLLRFRFAFRLWFGLWLYWFFLQYLYLLFASLLLLSIWISIVLRFYLLYFALLQKLFLLLFLVRVFFVNFSSIGNLIPFVILLLLIGHLLILFFRFLGIFDIKNWGISFFRFTKITILRWGLSV